MAFADIVEKISRISDMSYELERISGNAWKDECSSSDPDEIMKAVERIDSVVDAVDMSVKMVREKMETASYELECSKKSLLLMIDRGYDQFRLEEGANFASRPGSAEKEPAKEGLEKEGVEEFKYLLGVFSDILPPGQEHRIAHVGTSAAGGWALIEFVIPQNPGFYSVGIPVSDRNRQYRYTTSYGGRRGDLGYRDYGNFMEVGSPDSIPGRMSCDRRITMRFSLTRSSTSWRWDGSGNKGVYTVKDARKCMESEMLLQWNSLKEKIISDRLQRKGIAELSANERSEYVQDVEIEMLDWYERAVAEVTGIEWFQKFEDYPRTSMIEWNTVST